MGKVTDIRDVRVDFMHLYESVIYTPETIELMVSDMVRTSRRLTQYDQVLRLQRIISSILTSGKEMSKVVMSV